MFLGPKLNAHPFSFFSKKKKMFAMGTFDFVWERAKLNAIEWLKTMILKNAFKSKMDFAYTTNK